MSALFNLGRTSQGLTQYERVSDSRMHIANFDLGNGLIVSYVFNITRKDKFFLQRMRPYAMVKGKYADQREIIEFIKDDITRFKMSSQLNNIDKYIELAEKTGKCLRKNGNIFFHHFFFFYVFFQFICKVIKFCIKSIHNLVINFVM